MIQIGIVDDHPVTLLGMKAIFDGVPDIAVAMVHSDPDLIDAYALDAVLLDVYLTQDSPCLSAVERAAVHTKVIMTSASHFGPDVSLCLDAGAESFVHKGSPPRQFIDVVRQVATPAARRHNTPTLSPREQTVLQHIADGLTHDQIARRLKISKHTVDTYIKRIRSKLRLGNKAELARAALDTRYLAKIGS